MRAVVETNVLIRALIKPQGTVGPVLSRLAAGEYVLIYSQPLADELLAKVTLPRIRVKYHLDDQAIETTLALLAVRGELVQPTRVVRICRDPKDNMLIEAALAGAAQYVVTGDEDLLVLKRYETIQFVTPRAFLSSL